MEWVNCNEGITRPYVPFSVHVCIRICNSCGNHSPSQHTYLTSTAIWEQGLCQCWERIKKVSCNHVMHLQLIFFWKKISNQVCNRRICFFLDFIIILFYCCHESLLPILSSVEFCFLGITTRTKKQTFCFIL